MDINQYDWVVTEIRKEIKKYHDNSFSDEDHFIKDMKILSDDLMVILSELEKYFNIKINKEEYKTISNVNTLGKIFQRHLFELP
jgi:acyl carrier protein